MLKGDVEADRLYNLLYRQLQQEQATRHVLKAIADNLDLIADSLDTIAERLTRLASASDHRKDVSL